jgi:hypothetical protein
VGLLDDLDLGGLLEDILEAILELIERINDILEGNLITV